MVEYFLVFNELSLVVGIVSGKNVRLSLLPNFIC